MSFDALIAKVQQAEDALESRERDTTAQWRQFKATWRQSWTPGRIVIAGLAAGFMVGRARPLRAASGGGVLQMLSALSGRLASGSAHVAAAHADDAAGAAGQAANAAETAAAAAPNDLPSA
jgi:hypothetical protein